MKPVSAVAISSFREINEIREWYIAIQVGDDDFNGIHIEWNWYPETQIANLNEFIGNQSRRHNSLHSLSNSSKSKPDLQNIQIMKSDLLFSVNTNNPHLETVNTNSQTKIPKNERKILEIISYSKDPKTQQIIWKVKMQDCEQPIKISHSELCQRNKGLFVEYYRSHFLKPLDTPP